MIEKPSNSRVVVEDRGQELVLTIPSRKNWLIILFLSVWLGGWTVGGGFALTSLFRTGVSSSGGLFMLFWLCGWALGMVFVIYVLGWQFFGKEVAVASDSGVSLKRDVLGFGNPKLYGRDHIEELRISPATYNPFDWQGSMAVYGLGPGIIAFDYGARTVRFGSGLDEAEAKKVIQAIQMRFPEYA